MKINPVPYLLTLCITFIIAGCSGKGPDVTDPNSTLRNQVSLFSIKGTNGDQLLEYSEAKGTVMQDAYAAANGAPLGLPIDAIFTANARLYLHSRAAGTITIVDAVTQKKIGAITGFPASADSRLCGMAFSNLSDAWTICYGSDTLYLVDAVNIVIAQRIPLPGHPTSVGATGTKVFVGMQLPDGRGQVAILSSNGNFTIENTIDFPSPVIYAAPNIDKVDMIFISAGNASGDIKPTLHYINATQFTTTAELALNAPSLTSYIGQEPNFAAVSQGYYLYVATPQSLLRLDTQGKAEMLDWLVGNYRIVGIDPWTDLVYAYMDGALTIQRITGTGETLEDIAVSGTVKVITFISSNRVQ